MNSNYRRRRRRAENSRKSSACVPNINDAGNCVQYGYRT